MKNVLHLLNKIHTNNSHLEAEFERKIIHGERTGDENL